MAQDLSPAQRTLTVGVLGAGTVGSQVIRLLTEQADDFAARSGARLEITGVAVRDVNAPRDFAVPQDLLTDDATAVATGNDLVIELIGGIEPARTLILAAFKAGASVITGNKALIAAHGPELYTAAAAAGTDFYYEAAVAGAIPVVYALRESMAGDRVTSVLGIVNGTTNYILDEMSAKGLSFEEALACAQELGYAEADPTADVDGLDAAAGNAPKDEATRNRHRGLRLGVGMIVGGIAAFLFAIQVFLPAFNINGVWDYGLSSQDQPTSPDALTQKATVVVMLILTSGIVGVTSPWLLVVLPTLAWRFLGSVEFYWVWDNWHYNATLMPIALGALLDVVARRRAHGSYVADHPVRQVGVDGRAVMGRSAQAALAAGEAGTAGESDVDGPRRRPTAFPTWLTVPMRHRFVVATSILTAVATGVLTAPYLPLWQATNKNFDPLAAEAKQSNEAKRTETHRVAVAHEVIATIPEGATVVTDLSLLAYLVPRAEVSWAGTSGPDKEYIVMTPTSANQWGSSDAAAWGKKHSKQGATYTLIYNKDNYQIAKRNG